MKVTADIMNSELGIINFLDQFHSLAVIHCRSLEMTPRAAVMGVPFEEQKPVADCLINRVIQPTQPVAYTTCYFVQQIKFCFIHDMLCGVIDSRACVTGNPCCTPDTGGCADNMPCGVLDTCCCIYMPGGANDTAGCVKGME